MSSWWRVKSRASIDKFAKTLLRYVMFHPCLQSRVVSYVYAS